MDPEDMRFERSFDPVDQIAFAHIPFVTGRHRRCTSREQHSVSLVKPFARSDHAFPAVAPDPLDQKKLDMGACTVLDPVHPCRDDP